MSGKATMSRLLDIFCNKANNFRPSEQIGIVVLPPTQFLQLLRSSP
jgi:hypothetical protein